MKLLYNFKYFLEFIIISCFFFIFKVLGHKISYIISKKIFCFFGPYFRSHKTIENNFQNVFPNMNKKELEKCSKEMWEYYGAILAEYPFLKKLRNQSFNNIKIIGKNNLDEIKQKKEKVIFISGHFDNFELMAMVIEKHGIDVAAIYRPLNNFFLNPLMEKIRKNYICKNQIKKGRSSMKSLVSLFKNGSSIALMIDQRVSEGIKAKFFSKDAYTTTIPAQFVKKYNCRVVPIYIERINGMNFNIQVSKPIKFDQNDNILTITENLNRELEKMILLNPSKWIWTHNRWK